jgi:hypothetical protein
MTGNISLTELEAAYKRISRALYRAQEDALDFDAEVIFTALERDQQIADAAFFLVAFGQLERHINALAAARLRRPTQQAALREQPFERRLLVALPDDRQRPLRTEMARWYGIRNQAAHGDAIATEYNLFAVFIRIRELEAQVPVA